MSGRFGIVPASALEKGLSPDALAVLYALCCHANKDGACFPSRKRIADMLGRSPRWVTACIAKLIEAGIVVTRDGRRGQPRQLVIIVEQVVGEDDRVEAGFQGGGSGLPGGVEAGFHHNNTKEQNTPPIVPPAGGTCPPRLFGEEPQGQQQTKAEEAKYLDAFERFWDAYPRREGENPKKPARDKFVRACKRGADPEKIIAGAKVYADRVKAEQTPPKFVAQAVTWLNQERWTDDRRPVRRRRNWL